MIFRPLTQSDRDQLDRLDRRHALAEDWLDPRRMPVAFIPSWRVWWVVHAVETRASAPARVRLGLGWGLGWIMKRWRSRVPREVIRHPIGWRDGQGFVYQEDARPLMRKGTEDLRDG